MINTYNETTQHRELKELYAQKFGGKTEFSFGRHICDIYTEYEIIEIQTSSLSALKHKLESLLATHRVRVVFPLAVVTIIETRTPEGQLISRRKSPRKKNLYALYPELTGIYALLKNPDLILEILFIEQTEIRIKTAEPVQLKNKARRWKKNWYKSDKLLNKITDSRIFTRENEYLEPLAALLEPGIKTFSAPYLAKTAAGRYAGVLVWVLNKMNLITEAGKSGNTRLYRLAQNNAE